MKQTKPNIEEKFVSILDKMEKYCAKHNYKVDEMYENLQAVVLDLHYEYQDFLSAGEDIYKYQFEPNKVNLLLKKIPPSKELLEMLFNIDEKLTLVPGVLENKSVKHLGRLLDTRIYGDDQITECFVDVDIKVRYYEEYQSKIDIDYICSSRLREYALQVGKSEMIYSQCLIRVTPTKIIGDGIVTLYTTFHVNNLSEHTKFVNNVALITDLPEDKFFKIASKPTFEMENKIFQSVPENMSRTKITVDQVKISIFENFLSGEECRLLNDSANFYGFSSLEKEYPTDYRSNKRLVSYATMTSQTLWKRLQTLLKEDEFDKITPFGYGHEGIWKPIGLNPCFKFSLYQEGDFFAPHFDGIYIPLENQTTILTLMIYLNDDFDGGETKFYSSKNEKENFVVEPGVGKAILFNHDILHEGLKVKSGEKYILRTEIMFQRVNEYQIPKSVKNAYFYDENYRIAKNLYNKAEEYERIANSTEYTKSYLEALQIHLKHHKSFEIVENNHFIDDDCLVNIFSFLTTHELLSIMSVSHNWNYLSQNPKIWESMCKSKWNPRSLPGSDEKFIDWFGIYRKKRALELNYYPTIFKWGKRTSSFSRFGEPQYCLSLISRKRGYQVSWYRSPDSEAFDIGKKCLSNDDIINFLSNVGTFLNLLSGETLNYGPLLIVLPPGGFGEEDDVTFARNIIGDNHLAGFVSEYSSILAMQYYNLKSGFYLHISPYRHSFSFLKDGKSVEVMKIDHVEVESKKEKLPMFTIPDYNTIAQVMDKMIEKYDKSKECQIIVDLDCDNKIEWEKEIQDFKSALSKYPLICDTPAHYHFAGQKFVSSINFCERLNNF